MLRFLSKIFGKTPARSEMLQRVVPRSELQRKLGYEFRQDEFLTGIDTSIAPAQQ